MQNQEVYDELMAKFEKLYGVKPAAADKIAAAITAAYKTAYGDEPTCAVIKPSEGAHLV